MKLTNKVYDTVKWIALKLPYVITFVGILLPCVGVEPTVTQNVITIASAFEAMLCGILGISTISYNKEQKEQNTVADDVQNGSEKKGVDDDSVI